MKKVGIQAKSMLEQKKAAEVSARAIYDQEYDRLRDQEKDEKFYKMYLAAGRPGRLFRSRNKAHARRRAATMRSLLKANRSAKGRNCCAFPISSKMMVNAKVHEAMVSKLARRKDQADRF